MAKAKKAHYVDNKQLYAVYANENQPNVDDYNFTENENEQDYVGIHDLQPETVFSKQSNILKNFILPQKFGQAYQVQIFESDETFSGPGESIDIFKSPSTYNFNKQHGGYIFDYKEGLLFFGVGGDGDYYNNEELIPREPGQVPDLSGYRHPLWIKGYRYKGKTGSAGATTEITNETTVEATFDTTTFTLSVGGTEVNLAGLGQTFEQIHFEKDFARSNNRCSSSIAIMHDADADGFPYVTSSYESWILLNGIHFSDHNLNEYRSNDPLDLYKD